MQRPGNVNIELTLNPTGGGGEGRLYFACRLGTVVGMCARATDFNLMPDASAGEAVAWYAAHTRPRCEKKFAALLTAAGMTHELPLVRSQRRYGARVRVHSKPLFPGYVFVQVAAERVRECYQQNLLVRLIRVEDERTFARQLEEIRRIMASGLEAVVTPLFEKGRTVRVTAGPLRGLMGVVEDPARMDGVVVFMDVLQQAVRVKIPAMDLRLE